MHLHHSSPFVVTPSGRHFDKNAISDEHWHPCSMGARLRRRCRSTETCPRLAAIHAGLRPRTSGMVLLAPFLVRYLTTSSRPSLAARNRGVSPLADLQLGALLLSEVWKFFPQISTDVPALLNCAMLPRRVRGAHKIQLTKLTIQYI